MGLVGYLMSGQFWFSMFLSLLTAMVATMRVTGTTQGNLWMQLNLSNTRNKAVFAAIFIGVSAVMIPVLYVMGIGLAHL
jgi:hypothetical protein